MHNENEFNCDVIHSLNIFIIKNHMICDYMNIEVNINKSIKNSFIL